MRRQGGQYIDPNQMMQQQQQQQQQYSNYTVAGNAAYPGPAASDPMRPGDAYSYVASSRPSDGYTYVDPSSYPTGYVGGQAQKRAPKSQTPPNTNNNIEPQPAYEDNNNINNQTIEGLEQKFLQDIAKLSKEHNDAEDAEISRHRDRLIEISSQYQEKIAAIRAHHLKQREEFLKKEAQSRYNQSLQGGPHPNYPPGFPVETQHRTPNYPAGYGAELAQQQTGGYPPAAYGAEVAQQQTGGYPPVGGYGAEVGQQQAAVGYPPAGGYGAEVAQQQAVVGYPPAGGYGAEVAQQQAAVGYQGGGYNGGEVQQRPPYPGPAGAYGYHGGRGYNNAGGRQF